MYRFITDKSIKYYFNMHHDNLIKVNLIFFLFSPTITHVYIQLWNYVLSTVCSWVGHKMALSRLGRTADIGNSVGRN